MPFNRIQASKLCNTSEFQLFRASQQDLLKALSEVQLRRKIDRARALRDKHQDLFQRQRLATRLRTGTKLGPNKNSNERTRQKAQLFSEVLGRFEARLSSLETAKQRQAEREAREKEKALASEVKAKAKPPAKPAAKPAAKPKTPAKAKVKRSTTAGYMNPSASEGAQKQHLQNTRAKATQGHIRAVGQRKQAKRDKR